MLSQHSIFSGSGGKRCGRGIEKTGTGKKGGRCEGGQFYRKKRRTREKLGKVRETDQQNKIFPFATS